MVKAKPPSVKAKPPSVKAKPPSVEKGFEGLSESLDFTRRVLPAPMVFIIFIFI